MKKHIIFIHFMLALIVILPQTSSCDAKFTLTRLPNAIRLTTAKLNFDITKEPINFILSDRKGQIILSHAPGAGICLRAGAERFSVVGINACDEIANGVVLHCALENGATVQLTVEIKSDAIFKLRLDAPDPPEDAAWELRYRVQPNEHFYGFGERVEGYENEAFDQRGTEVSMWRKGTQGVYVPFFMSTAGYGVFVCSNERGLFDLAKSDSSTLSINYETHQLKWTIFYGPRLSAILNHYSNYAGQSLVPPRWAFEPWKWRNEIKGDWEMLEDADKLRDFNIPSRVMILDRPHFTGAMDFQFNPVQFPDIEATLDQLHRQGFRVLLWSAPFVEGNSRLGREGLENGYFLKFRDGRPFSGNDFLKKKKRKPKLDVYFVDFTHPAAVEWWTRQLVGMLNLGFDGFKLDRSDEIVPQTDDVIYFNGKSGAEMYNAYATLYIETFYKACQQARGGDFLIYARPGFSGSQQFAAFFSGDTDPTWAHFRKNLITALRAGLSGFPLWGHQTGGYRCKQRFGPLPTKECFIRWTQFGAFSPIMERGGLWLEEPWDWDTETLDMYRTYATLHSELVPYILSYAHEAQRTGLPIMCAMALAEPDNPQVLQMDDQYLFGDVFLVAPIYDSTTSARGIYLPEGRWINYWDEREMHLGPKSIRVDAPLDQLPLFIRAGAIIPMNVRDASTGHGAYFSDGHLTYDIFPFGDSEFVLRDETGEHPVRCQQSENGIRLRFENNRQPLMLRVKTADAPNQALLNGDRPLRQVRKLHQLADADGWYYDQKDARVWVNLRAMAQFELLLDFRTKFSDWSFPEIISDAGDGIPISVTASPELKRSRLVYQQKYGAEKRIRGRRTGAGKLEFWINFENEFQGEIEFCVEGENRQQQMVRSETHLICVDDDTTGPIFRNWVFPDTVISTSDFWINVDILDPSGVSKSKWGHAPLQIYWRTGSVTRHSFGEKRVSIFKEKNQDRFPKIKGDTFSFRIPAASDVFEGELYFWIEAWDYDDTPAKSVSGERKIWVKQTH